MSRQRRLWTPTPAGWQTPREEFGLVPVTSEQFGLAPSSRMARSGGSSFADPRLRGLTSGQVTPVTASGVSMSGARHGIMNGDPYEQQARQQREIGRRMPLPYQAPTALAGMPSSTGQRIRGSYQDLHGENSLYSAQAIAGQRQTQWGTFGAMSDPMQEEWSARQQFGYGQAKVRGPGFSDEWDTPASMERTAGRLEKTGAFDQAVVDERPYLHLRASGTSTQPEGTFSGNALMRVTAGNFENGQGTQVREFLIGGGMVANFVLRGWNNVKINVLELMEDTFVEFAWTTRGLAGENRSLYLPQRYETGGGQLPVPEGAFGLIMENPVPGVAGTTVTLTWVSYIGGAPFTFTQEVSDNSVVAAPRPYAYFGTVLPILGPTFAISSNTDIVWQIRPI